MELLSDALSRMRISHQSEYRDLHILLIGATSTHVPTMERVQRMTDKEPCITQRSNGWTGIPPIKAQGDADRLRHLGFRGKKGIFPLKFLEYIHAEVPTSRKPVSRNDIYRKRS